ncbi:hypothetical protein TIFTF001_029336 [Ficus carica]|uniref:Uncharacterized protein n=1 Tax=Ficus carica TaxID=3494 RepID=A0AA88J2B1_FICCA|nr:hypothetical protein TIFTF001_029336 [Ficus carica]
MSQDHEEEVSTKSQIGKRRRTCSPRFNPDEDGKRRATLMRRVNLVRTKGELIVVSFDAKRQPLGKEGDELQSWIGVLVREHIPIWISDFRSADLAPRKERFEKTGKWAARHTVWLDMRIKPDGEFKNPSFKISSDTILAALERTVQELCAKHSINRETIIKKTIAPTVDQHNNFKASCTLNEKETGTSDPQPMPNAIHRIPLGEENVRVIITVPKLKRALLPIPTNEVTIKESFIELKVLLCLKN